MAAIDWLPFLVSAIVLEITPGPNMGFIMVVAMHYGKKAGFATILGIALGLSVLGLAAIFGAAQIIQTQPGLLAGLRWAGLFLLLFLAFDLYRGQPAFVASLETEKQEGGEGPILKYVQRGLLTNLLNPKAALFFLIVMPQFISSTLDTNSPERRMAAYSLLAVYIAIATGIHALLVVVGGQLGTVLANQRTGRFFTLLMASLLVAVAIWQFIATAP